MCALPASASAAQSSALAAASAAAIKEKVSKSNLVLYTNLCTRGGCGCRRCRCWLAVLSAPATAAVAEAEVVVAVVLLFLLLPQLLWWLFEVSFIFFVAFVSQFLFPLVVAVVQL